MSMAKKLEKILSLFCVMESSKNTDEYYAIRSMTLEPHNKEKQLTIVFDGMDFIVNIDNIKWLTDITENMEGYADDFNVKKCTDTVVEDKLGDIIGMPLFMQRCADRNDIEMHQTITMAGGVVKVDIAIEKAHVLAGEWATTPENLTDLVRLIDKVNHDLWCRCHENRKEKNNGN